MVAGVKMPGIGGGFGNLSDFRELSFCGPFTKKIIFLRMFLLQSNAILKSYIH